MKLIDGKARRLFDALWSTRSYNGHAQNGWWFGMTLASIVNSYCMSTYMSDVKQFVNQSVQYAAWRVESQRMPPPYKNGVWRYRLVGRNAKGKV
jgi:hypothetical protein